MFTWRRLFLVLLSVAKILVINYSYRYLTTPQTRASVFSYLGLGTILVCLVGLFLIAKELIFLPILYVYERHVIESYLEKKRNKHQQLKEAKEEGSKKAVKKVKGARTSHKHRKTQEPHYGDSKDDSQDQSQIRYIPNDMDFPEKNFSMEESVDPQNDITEPLIDESLAPQEVIEQLPSPDHPFNFEEELNREKQKKKEKKEEKKRLALEQERQQQELERQRLEQERIMLEQELEKLRQARLQEEYELEQRRMREEEEHREWQRQRKAQQLKEQKEAKKEKKSKKESITEIHTSDGLQQLSSARQHLPLMREEEILNLNFDEKSDQEENWVEVEHKIIAPVAQTKRVEPQELVKPPPPPKPVRPKYENPELDQMLKSFVDKIEEHKNNTYIQLVAQATGYRVKGTDQEPRAPRYTSQQRQLSQDRTKNIQTTAQKPNKQAPQKSNNRAVSNNIRRDDKNEYTQVKPERKEVSPAQRAPKQKKNENVNPPTSKRDPQPKSMYVAKTKDTKQYQDEVQSVVQQQKQEPRQPRQAPYVAVNKSNQDLDESKRDLAAKHLPTDISMITNSTRSEIETYYTQSENENQGASQEKNNQPSKADESVLSSIPETVKSASENNSRQTEQKNSDQKKKANIKDIQLYALNKQPGYSTYLNNQSGSNSKKEEQSEPLPQQPQELNTQNKPIEQQKLQQEVQTKPQNIDQSEPVTQHKPQEQAKPTGNPKHSEVDNQTKSIDQQRQPSNPTKEQTKQPVQVEATHKQEIIPQRQVHEETKQVNKDAPKVFFQNKSSNLENTTGRKKFGNFRSGPSNNNRNNRY